MNGATVQARVIAAVNAQFTTARAVDIEDAPSQGSDHVIVFVERRFTDGAMASGEPRWTGWRVVTRYVCRTASNVQVMRDRTTAALESKFLPDEVGPFAFEQEIEPLRFDTEEGGWFTSADSWVF